MAAYRSDNLFRVILELSKVRITIAVSLTTIAGYVLWSRTFDLFMFIPVSGIFILACGASVVNHIQERKTDNQMDRTSKRPLPSGKISLTGAIILAILEISAGLFILWRFTGLIPFLLGLTALLWYNLIYTNLKKITVHAVIPGSVIGSIPPLVGWVSAGGPLFDIRSLAIALFFFAWQVPHFYLLAYKYATDYKNAGFPSLYNRYTAHQIWYLVFFWILATVATAIFLPVSGVTRSVITLGGILLFSAWLIREFAGPLKNGTDRYSPGKYFMKINYYVLGVVLLQIFDMIFSKAL